VPRPLRIQAAASGGLAAGVGLGISELFAGLIAPVPSLVEGIGNWVIDNVPPAVKDWAIAVFGANDKLVLLVGIAVVAILIGSFVGVFARKRFGLAVAAFVGFGVLAGAATAIDPRVSVISASVPAGAAVVAGLGTLRLLHGLSEPDDEGSAFDSRRNFLLGAGAVIALAAGAGVVGRVLLEQAKRAVAGRDEVVLPSAAQRLAPVASAANFEVEGLEEILVPTRGSFGSTPRSRYPESISRSGVSVSSGWSTGPTQSTSPIFSTCAWWNGTSPSPVYRTGSEVTWSAMPAGWGCHLPRSSIAPACVRMPARSSAGRSTTSPSGSQWRRLTTGARRWWRWG
jgi:hypothetical protein